MAYRVESIESFEIVDGEADMRIVSGEGLHNCPEATTMARSTIRAVGEHLWALAWACRREAAAPVRKGSLGHGLRPWAGLYGLKSFGLNHALEGRMPVRWLRKAPAGTPATTVSHKVAALDTLNTWRAAPKGVAKARVYTLVVALVRAGE